VLSLDVLPKPDAAALFGKVVGADRVAGHDGAVQQVVELCGRLPLAVRVAAARLGHRPMWTAEQLAVRLGREHDRLGMLADGERSVAAAFAVSYRDLDAGQQSLFQFLGLHPGTDFDVYAAAALADIGVDAAERLLDELLDAHLIGDATPGRYRFHDLMREYAAGLAVERATEAERTAALARLLDYYLGATAAAVGTIMPSRRRRTPALTAVTTGPAPILSTAEARTWLDDERTNLVSLIVRLDDRRWASQLSALIQILGPELIIPGEYGAEALTVNTRLLHIAHDQEDRLAEAAALDGLGRANIVLRQFPEAFDCGQQALRLYREIGDGAGECSALNCIALSFADSDWIEAAAYLRQALAAARAAGDDEGEARSLNNLAATCGSQGRYREAILHLTESVAMHERAGNTAWKSMANLGLGRYHLQLGRDELALDHLQQAFALAREFGARSIEPAALDSVGQVLRRRGRHAEALDHHRQALALARALNDEHAEAGFLASLGETRQAQGDTDGALNDLRQAVALANRSGDLSLRARALNSLGYSMLTTNQPQEARANHAAALELSTRAPDRYEQARALDGIAAASDRCGDRADAHRLWLEALSIYTELEVPETEVTRTRLAAMDDEAASGPMP
jgi:tetratricopeptide (TPR) repeat protein